MQCLPIVSLQIHYPSNIIFSIYWILTSAKVSFLDTYIILMELKLIRIC